MKKAKRQSSESRKVKRADQAASGIVSMSGFGAGRSRSGSRTLNVEIRSLNSRYFDCSVRVPNQFSGDLESQIKEHLEPQLQRGRVEVTVTVANDSRKECAVFFDEKLFTTSLATLKRSKKIFAVISDDDLAEMLLARKEIFDFVEGSPKRDFPDAAVWSGLKAALAQMMTMRSREGKRLASDISERLIELDRVRSRVVALVKRQPEKLQNDLTAKLNSVLTKDGLDLARLEQEVALLVSRADVHEELTRLASHIAEFKRLMKDGASGKRLDFLTQEFLRELNTIGSKVGLAAAQHEVVAGKGIVERIKEQVQNVV